jgi:hypothetical protein
MRETQFKYLIFFLFVSFLFSCQKNPSLQGKWLLIDGEMHFENLDTRELSYMNHFDSNKKISSLDYHRPVTEFDIIEKDKTTWEFKGGSQFILNDTINYNGQISENLARVYLRNGSAAIIQLYDLKKDILQVTTMEKYAPIDGYNYKYGSLLTFKRIK